jgi:hypothetical protein
MPSADLLVAQMLYKSVLWLVPDWKFSERQNGARHDKFLLRRPSVGVLRIVFAKAVKSSLSSFL